MHCIDAGNRNPREPSPNIPCGFKQLFHHSGSAFTVPLIPNFPTKLSQGRTESSPNNSVSIKSIGCLFFVRILLVTPTYESQNSDQSLLRESVNNLTGDTFCDCWPSVRREQRQRVWAETLRTTGLHKFVED